MTILPPQSSAQAWSAEIYDRNARFVSDLGDVILSWFNVQQGERVLDLGCGDGVLTEKLVVGGADVLGVDASEAMVAAASKRGLDVECVDGHELTFKGEFDAVFSNAALHWMLAPEKVLAGVYQALKPGGRFVAELGGFGNVAAIDAVLRAAGLGVQPHDLQETEMCFFPTPEHYQSLLEQAGFEVTRIELVPRPTFLPTGLAGWLETFRQPFFDQFEEGERANIMRVVTAALKPALCDEAGGWWADYVRLRVAANKPA